MSSVRLPAYAQDEMPGLDSVIRSVLDVDQWDDWVHDPVYHEDRRRNRDKVRERIDRVWRGGAFDVPAPTSSRLPRRSGAEVTAVVHPFDLRVAAHRVIAAMARRIAASIDRNKVHGFEYTGDWTLFAVAGTGIGKAADDVFTVLFTRPFVQVVDVERFLANTRFDVLGNTLRSAGARPDEVEFLRAVFPVEGHLPAADDAFAFLTNFYLSAVDKRLKERKELFVRHGDEYFVFDANALQTVESGLRALGLRGVAGPRIPSETLRSKFDDPSQTQIQAIFGQWVSVYGNTFGAFYIEDVECPGNPYVCVPPFWNLETLGAADVLDAYQLLPLTREIHRSRADAVALMPPFDRASDDFRSYSGEVQKRREWLRRALVTAAKTGSGWQAAWAAPVLSDAGPLADVEIGALTRVAESSKFEEAARAQALIALARCSAVPAARIVKGFESGSSPYFTRCALLAGSYLARRDRSFQWEPFSKRFGGTEEDLATLLAGHVREG